MDFCRQKSIQFLLLFLSSDPCPSPKNPFLCNRQVRTLRTPVNLDLTARFSHMSAQCYFYTTVVHCMNPT